MSRKEKNNVFEVVNNVEFKNGAFDKTKIDALKGQGRKVVTFFGKDEMKRVNGKKMSNVVVEIEQEQE